jgi:hypothetical protein
MIVIMRMVTSMAITITGMTIHAIMATIITIMTMITAIITIRIRTPTTRSGRTV